jgi:hypothetical protein
VSFSVDACPATTKGEVAVNDVWYQASGRAAATRMVCGTDDRYLSYLVQFIKPGGFIGVVDIAFRRDVRSIEDAPEYLRPQYQKHWSYVHSVAWWTQHWEKTGVVDVRCAELLPESEVLLRHCVRDRPPEQDEDSIMRAVPHDDDGFNRTLLYGCMQALRSVVGVSGPNRSRGLKIEL